MVTVLCFLLFIYLVESMILSGYKFRELKERKKVYRKIMEFYILKIENEAIIKKSLTDE